MIINNDMLKVACINCKWFEGRSKFCRINPPTSIVTDNYSNKDTISCVFPKIPFPDLDFCGKFEQKTLN
jgi:hypothetical protein